MLAAGDGWSAFGDAADSQIVMVLATIAPFDPFRPKPTPRKKWRHWPPATWPGRPGFLGWLRLTFSNGQTGWVRKGEVIWLWK